MTRGDEVRLLYAVFITLLAPCGGETGVHPSRRRARTVRSTAGFEEVYRIGGIEAEGWDAFTKIADLDFDARGHLYIRAAAASSTRIVVLDGLGGLAAEFGRMG